MLGEAVDAARKANNPKTWKEVRPGAAARGAPTPSPPSGALIPCPAPECLATPG